MAVPMERMNGIRAPVAVANVNALIRVMSRGKPALGLVEAIPTAKFVPVVIFVDSWDMIDNFVLKCPCG